MFQQNYGGSTLTYTTTNMFQPNAEAYIAKSKSRLKQHGQIVYLKNGDNFEIELFNPRSVSILVKIKINGSYVSNTGLILRPGQRYWLDRYLDVAKKFLYTTYEIDGNNSQAVAAAAQNGKVEIEFYDEKTKALEISVSPPYPNQPYWYMAQDQYMQNNNRYDLKTSNVTMDSMNSFCSNTMDGKLTSTAYKNNILRSASASLGGGSLSMETGRVEKGESSNQRFETADMDFNWFTTSVCTWFIKPESAKPVEVAEIKHYCTECGKKLKSADKFCSSCGTKVSA